jgi:hypothetical protein
VWSVCRGGSERTCTREHVHSATHNTASVRCPGRPGRPTHVTHVTHATRRCSAPGRRGTRVRTAPAACPCRARHPPAAQRPPCPAPRQQRPRSTGRAPPCAPRWCRPPFGCCRCAGRTPWLQAGAARGVRVVCGGAGECGAGEGGQSAGRRDELCWRLRVQRGRAVSAPCSELAAAPPPPHTHTQQAPASARTCGVLPPPAPLALVLVGQHGARARLAADADVAARVQLVGGHAHHAQEVPRLRA